MKPALDIVFVTYADLKQGDPDDRQALEILMRRGYQCCFADWRDERFSFADAALVVLRSTWDYHLHHQQFKDWLQKISVASVLKNDLEQVLWNSDKRYLRDLAAAGINVVPTHYIEVGASETINSASLSEIAARLQVESGATGDDMRVVIKPSVGLSTFGVKKFDLSRKADGEAAIHHINELNRSYCVMVQPFMAEVEKSGEKALVFIDGKFSHAIKKSPFQHLAVAGEAGEASVAASASEIACGEQVLAALKFDAVPLYARVDVIADSAAVVRLLELELIEPSLFLQLADKAAEKFADALESCLKTS